MFGGEPASGQQQGWRAWRLLLSPPTFIDENKNFLRSAVSSAVKKKRIKISTKCGRFHVSLQELRCCWQLEQIFTHISCHGGAWRSLLWLHSKQVVFVCVCVFVRVFKRVERVKRGIKEYLKESWVNFIAYSPILRSL